jgi:hypothetical protein
MDAVADVFQSMHIASVIQARLEASAPWGLKRNGNAKEGEGRHSAARSSSPFAHFGMVTDCSCWLTRRRLTRSNSAFGRGLLPVCAG